MIRFLRLCAALAIGLAATAALGIAVPRADYNGERRIQMFNIHTQESIDIVYKKDGEFIPEALDQLNYFMRDWRANKQTKMDPHTIDLVWEIHEELGSKVPVHLICGFRSSGTNEALRNAGGGQAKFSQHILGKAMDVTFPDIPVQKLRYAGLVREAGGVGYYPTSGVPFVHIDTGTVRMWPRMPRYELALLFPKGHSKFVPADGRPISVADVSYARAHYTQMADAIAAFHQFRGQAKDRTLVASLEASQPAADPAPQAGETDASSEDAAPAETAAAIPVAAVASKPVQVAEASASEVPALSGPALKPVKTKVVVKISKPVVASFTLASLTGLVPPKPALAVRPALARSSDQLSIAATVSAGDSDAVPPEPQETVADGAFMDKAGWVSEPGYDEEHDSELSYRPFPLAGLIEANPSVDNPVLAKLVKPNLAAAHLSIGNDDGMKMQFRPALQVAEMIWNDDYAGRDLNRDLYAEAAGGNVEAGSGRLVHTASAN